MSGSVTDTINHWRSACEDATVERDVAIQALHQIVQLYNERKLPQLKLAHDIAATALKNMEGCR